MSNFARKRAVIRDNILKLAKEHPSVLEDDRRLIQYYWYYTDGLNVFIPFETLEKLTQPESITREMRRIVEEGLLTRPEKARRNRSQQERQYHDHYGKKEDQMIF